MSISRGQQRPEENYEEISYSPQAGWNRRAGLVGPKQGLKAMLQELADRGVSFTYSCDQNPLGAIRFETPGNPESNGEPPAEVPTLVWEFFSSRSEIDLMAADLNGSFGTANLAAMSDGDKTLLRNRINGNDIVYDPVALGADFHALFQLIDQGVRSFVVNVPSIRRSLSVSNAYTAAASQSNVRRIISTETLRNQENVPATFLINLPAYSSAKPGFEYGWYKNSPGLQTAGGNKYQITQEWEYGLWPTKLHGTVL